MISEDILTELERLADPKYREFQGKLIPGEKLLGVRTPALRELAKSADLEDIQPPYELFEEKQLKSFCICRIRDFDECIAEVRDFLPYVDNWATCDMLSPKVFRRNREKLLRYIVEWLASDREFTVRFGVKMLMDHFLGEDYDPIYPGIVSKVPADAYYVSMGIAWYFATGLALRYDDILPYIEEKRLDKDTHNRTISKALDSFRISADKKGYLKGLRI